MDGYGDGDTSDFFSQPNPYSPASGYNMYSDMADPFLGSSGVHAP